MTLKERVAELEKVHKCNCNLDNWQPQITTGHSWVCRIHRLATGQSENLPDTRTPEERAYDAWVTSGPED
jgi:hypothetical protein